MERASFCSLAVVIVLAAAGCRAHKDSPPQESKYIQTAYGTTGDVPYEVAVSNLDVTADLHASAGTWISIIGARHNVNGRTAIWIPDGATNVTIIVEDQKPWSGAPSHRSLINISGFLTIENGKMFLNHTTWRWIDS